MAVVVEPVVTQEKLLMLLAEQCEQTTLDYKSTLTLNERRDIVELAKDVAAMQAEAHGGYIVVGADDHGNLTGALSAEQAKLFDEATLRPKLAKYLDSPRLRTAIHWIEGKCAVVLHIAPAVGGWCVFRANGEYEDQRGKKVVAFRVGDVFVRHGTSSERWTDTDLQRLINQVVERRKDQWRRETFDEVAEQIGMAKTVADRISLPASALSWRMDDSDFLDVVLELLRRDDDIPLRRLLTGATHDAAALLADDVATQPDTADERRHLLDQLTTIAALTIHYRRPTWTPDVVATLVRIYELPFEEYGPDPSNRAAVQTWLDIVVRVYALGALAVRTKEWSTVRMLADRRPDAPAFDHFGGWLRHGFTMAARANTFREDTAGLLARAHNIIRSLEALHPDLPAEHRGILASLCQFDAYAALAVIGGRGSTESRNFYPNFVPYHSRDTVPAFRAVVTDPAVRKAIFSGTDHKLAAAIAAISQSADREGANYLDWRGINDEAVIQFVTQNGVRLI